MSKFICDNVMILEREPITQEVQTKENYQPEILQIGETVTLEISLTSSGYTKDITHEQIVRDILSKLEAVGDEPREVKR